MINRLANWQIKTCLFVDYKTDEYKMCFDVITLTTTVCPILLTKKIDANGVTTLDILIKEIKNNNVRFQFTFSRCLTITKIDVFISIMQANFNPLIIRCD